jgi:hypothetical protein
MFYDSEPCLEVVLCLLKGFSFTLFDKVQWTMEENVLDTNAGKQLS